MAATHHRSIIESARGRESPLVTLVTFRDGIGLALELADTYPAATAGLLIGSEGVIERQGIAPGPPLETTLATLEWLLGVARGTAQRRWAPNARKPPQKRTVLITIDRDRPFLLAEHDVHLFRWAAQCLAALQTPLEDWIHSDGDLVRSAAFAADPRRAWPRDPPDDRLLDQATMA